MTITGSRIELRVIDELKPHPSNARTHSAKQIEQIAKSIGQFEFVNPVLIDNDGCIIAGHGRVMAMKKLGRKQVPCVRVLHLSEAQKRAYIIADNRLAEKAGWNKEILAIELQGLMDLKFDAEITGFDALEIDALLVEASEATVEGSPALEDDIPEPTNTPAVTRPGDLWQLGRHLLLCGDARDEKSYQQLLGNSHADMMFTDPPYNVPIEGHVSGAGRIKHRDFVSASGELSKAQFTEFLTQSMSYSAKVCRNGAIAYVCMDWRHVEEISAAGKTAFAELKNICVWNKTNGGMGTFYRSKHELVFVWKVGDAPHINTFGLGDKGRYRTNVWTYAGVNSFKADRMEELTSHPTVKPVALVADAIRDVSHRGHVVLDPFGGSGTTLVAAQNTGRMARVIELDPKYCDVIIRRFEKLTGAHATLVDGGASFEQVDAFRNGDWTSSPMAVSATSSLKAPI
jgi:DNA modification methylase